MAESLDAGLKQRQSKLSRHLANGVADEHWVSVRETQRQQSGVGGVQRLNEQTSQRSGVDRPVERWQGGLVRRRCVFTVWQRQQSLAERQVGLVDVGGKSCCGLVLWWRRLDVGSRCGKALNRYRLSSARQQKRIGELTFCAAADDARS